MMLSVFDHSGVMALPWAEAGYECVCVDIKQQPAPLHPRISHIVAEVPFWQPPRDVAFAAFFPPCTHLAASGARWFAGKGQALRQQAMALVYWSVGLGELLQCPYLIENPASVIGTEWRPPDYTFDPCDYGDPYTKRTCLWTGGGFVMPPSGPLPLFGDAGTRVEPVEGSKMHRLPESADLARLRSQTPEGFARAVFAANRHWRAAS